ncbi:hypothetical protein BCY89_01860 [Sphingobacterium siyangense]|uniref:Uncharacterized protein n=1 Tax=Sphingobacterium siyangense TaxID=459529 RepID=A0A420GAP3_9SPHI|nr:hypothetical protein BCY89_01860 [Sphingobacterium siyangense]
MVPAVQVGKSMATMSMAIMGKLDKRFIKAQITITQMQIRPNQTGKRKAVTMMTNILIRITTMIPMKILNMPIVSTVSITLVRA